MALRTYLPPVIFVQSIPANSRRVFVSNLITRPFFLETVRMAFALNCQRYLRVTPWVVDVDAVANDTRPTGINLFSTWGGQDYVVGSGDEGGLIIPIGRRFETGRIAFEAYNTDAVNVHTLDVRADLIDVTVV